MLARSRNTNMFKVLIINPCSKYKDFYGEVESEDDIFGDDELCFRVKMYVAGFYVKLNFRHAELMFL